MDFVDSSLIYETLSSRKENPVVEDLDVGYHEVYVVAFDESVLISFLCGLNKLHHHKILLCHLEGVLDAIEVLDLLHTVIDVGIHFFFNLTESVVRRISLILLEP